MNTTSKSSLENSLSQSLQGNGIKLMVNGHRPCDCIQKYQTPHPEGTHHDPKKEGLDEPNHGQFRVTIILACSDKRQRDLDGAAATLLDCIVDASKRFAAMDS